MAKPIQYCKVKKKNNKNNKKILEHADSHAHKEYNTFVRFGCISYMWKNKKKETKNLANFRSESMMQ